MKLTIRHARKVLKIIDAGLYPGLGTPVPGKMCVEAAVCFALGEPHGDKPVCVARPDRNFKIVLNDAAWSSPTVRAAGLRRIGVMQLGTAGMDRQAWSRILTALIIRRVVPVALRAARLEHAARRCEIQGTDIAARAAADDAAHSVHAAAADAYAAASAAVYAAASAAAYAGDAAHAAAGAAAYAGDAAHAAAHAANDAAHAAARAAKRVHVSAARDHVLHLAAACAEEAYERTGSPGVNLLRRIEDGE